MSKKGFSKGDPNINRAGRPKGVPNKSTEELRSTLKAFIEGNLERMQADFDALEPHQRLTMLERFLRHVLPPMVTDLSQLSEKDLDVLLERLKQSA